MTEWHPLRSLADQNKEDPEWRSLNKEAEQLASNATTATMPSLDHLSYRDFEQIYEPAEDTYLLLDTLQYEMEQGNIINDHGHVTVLEIGCGSGVASVFVQVAWNKAKSSGLIGPSATLLAFATDINPYALKVTRQTATESGVGTDCIFELIQCDLATPLLPRLAGCVRVLLFNPPYVPTPDDEVGSHGIEAAWAGGTNGRRVIDRALPQIAQLLLRPAGVAYMVTVDDNLPAELAKDLQVHDLVMKPLLRRRARNEYLTIQKITWKQDERSFIDSDADI